MSLVPNEKKKKKNTIQLNKIKTQNIAMDIISPFSTSAYHHFIVLSFSIDLRMVPFP